jgi:hypothetical protein
LCRPNTYGAELTLSRFMRLHMVGPTFRSAVRLLETTNWLYFRCCGKIVSICFCVFGLGLWVLRAIKSIFIGFRNIFNPPWTRDTVKTTEQQDTGHTDMFSCRQYSRYITVVLFGPLMELQNYRTDTLTTVFWHCCRLRSRSEAVSMNWRAKWQATLVRFCTIWLNRV